MAIADEHVGILNPEESKGRKQNVRKDEMTYVKYVRAREALQSRVLLMSDALKEDKFPSEEEYYWNARFPYQLNTLKTRVVQNEEEEQPKKKKRRATQSVERPQGQENEEGDTRVTEEPEDITMQEGEADTSQPSMVY